MFKVSVYHTHTLGSPRPKMIFMKGFNFLFWGKVMYGLEKKGAAQILPKDLFQLLDIGECPPQMGQWHTLPLWRHLRSLAWLGGN
jgi:hypothetical protein